MEKSIGTLRQRQFGGLLRAVREEAGLSQAELAERLSTGQSRISEYETGQRRIDLVQIEEYCEALGIDFVAFMRRFKESAA